MKMVNPLMLVAAFALAGAGAASAADSAVGTWSVKIAGDEAPCAVTLSADAVGDAGTATAAQDCSGRAQQIGRWSQTAGKLTLKKASGETIAVLSPKDGDYVGKRFADYRKMTLTPVNSTVAQSK